MKDERDLKGDGRVYSVSGEERGKVVWRKRKTNAQNLNSLDKDDLVVLVNTVLVDPV
jgi:hypothetical protein